jgi:simple sugar transport system permease protein
MLRANPLVLLPRQHIPLWLSVLTLSAGIVLGLLLATGVLLVSGVAVKGIVNEFILYSFSNSRGLAQTLTKATSLLLVGLASAVSLKLRFWNINSWRVVGNGVLHHALVADACIECDAQ